MFYEECIGMEFMIESDEDYDSFVKRMIVDAEETQGYDKTIYLKKRCGDVYFYAEFERNDEESTLQLRDFMFHSNNDKNLWTVLVGPSDIKYDRQIPKIVMKRPEDGKGIAIADLINSSVLPSYLENDEITVRMMGLPVTMNYYADEEGYIKDQPGRYTLANGMIFPGEFIRNHEPDRDEEIDDSTDNINIIRGTVREVLPGNIMMDGFEEHTFLRCYIETEFGTLEVFHTEKMIKEEQWKNMRSGSVVYGAFRLFADVMVGDHEGGPLARHEHILRLLRFVLVSGRMEKLALVLDDESQYCFETWEKSKTIHGKEIIGVMQAYHRVENVEYCLATISEADGDSESGALYYKKGERCIVLKNKENGVYFALFFIDVFKGYITRIFHSHNVNYHFIVDSERKFGWEENTVSATANSNLGDTDERT